MSNQGGNQGWHPPSGNFSTYPSVGRFENESATNTLYTKGSSAKFTDNDGRKSIAPYSNHGHLSQEPPSESQPEPQPQPQQPSSGIVGLRTAPYTGSQDANWGGPCTSYCYLLVFALLPRSQPNRVISRGGDVDDIISCLHLLVAFASNS